MHEIFHHSTRRSIDYHCDVASQTSHPLWFKYGTNGLRIEYLEFANTEQK